MSENWPPKFAHSEYKKFRKARKLTAGCVWSLELRIILDFWILKGCFWVCFFTFWNFENDFGIRMATFGGVSFLYFFNLRGSFLVVFLLFEIKKKSQIKKPPRRMCLVTRIEDYFRFLNIKGVFFSLFLTIWNFKNSFRIRMATLGGTVFWLFWIWGLF